MEIREFTEADRDVCRDVLDALPDWFGIEDANREYLASLGRWPSAVAEHQGAVIGFTSIERHDQDSAELYVIAVKPDCHRSGAGRLLLAWVEDYCRAEGVRFLHVKTRGPLTPDPGYERTRQFYLASGFSKLFETLELWGPQDSALVMVKTVASDPR